MANQKRQKRAGDDSDTPFSPRALSRGRDAVLAYRVSIYGLIPGLGLLLGPIAFLLGLWVRLRHRKEKRYKGRPLANAAMILGMGLWVTTWTGLALILLSFE